VNLRSFAAKGDQVNRAAPAAVSAVVDAADDAVLRTLYDQHAGPVYAVCLRWTGDAQRAEDVVQEVFLRAWRKLGKVDLAGQGARPWLLAVAKNVLIDQHRASQRRPVTSDDDAALAVLPAPDELDRAVESWQVAAALARLSQEHREVLVHAHWLGHSVGETARLLGVPAGTVKSRTYYAVRALRLTLEEMGVGA